MASILGASTAWVDVEPTATGFGEKAQAQITAALARVNANIPVTVDQAKLSASVAFASAKLGTLKVGAAAVQAQLSTLRANVDSVAAEAQIAALQVRAQSLQKALASAGSGANFAKLESQLLNVQAGAQKAGQALTDAGDAANHSAPGLATWTRLGSAIDAVSSIHVPLFATSMRNAGEDASVLDKGLTALGSNFLTSASGAHIAAEAVIEFVAIWGPATLAVGLFGLAALPTIKDIGQQLKNMNTTSDATGAKFKTLTSSSNGLVASLKPQVMTLFGEGLLAASSGSGQLEKSLSAVGGVLDKFGAKIDQLLSSKTTSTFLSKAAGDVQGLGDAFTQVGRIIGDLLQDVPGYAEILLKLGDAALTAGANVVGALNPVIKAFLAIHGAVFYVGLATTLLGTLGKAAVTSFAQVAAGGDKVEATGGKLTGLGTAIGNMSGALVAGAGLAKNYAAEIVGIGKESGVAAAGGTLLSDALEAVPFGPVGLAVGVAAGLIGVGLYAAFHQTASAADQLAASMAKLISGSNIIDIQQNIAEAAQKTSAQIGAEAKTVDALTEANRKTGDAVVNFHTGDVTAYGKQLETLTSQIGTNQAALSKYADQNATVAVRLNGLSDAYGSTTAASELMTLAGVKQSDVANANAGAWATDLVQIKAAAVAYGVMGQQTGAAGNQLDTLTISTGSTEKAVQSLIQAEQAWLGLITGGDSAFTSFEQGQKTLAADMAGGSAAGVKLTATSGKLHDQLVLTGTALNGTSDSAIAARQAFDSQITSAGTLYGNLQNLAAASGNSATAQSALGKAGKDLIAQLLPMAAGSKEATAEVFALAQVAGFTGPDSFAALTKWLGNTKNAESDLDTQQGKLTISSASLSDAARNLSGALNNTVAVMQGQALLATSGFQNAQNALINTLQKSGGVLTTVANNDAVQYYNALIKAGVGATQAKDDTDALLQKLNVAPGTISAVNTQLDGMATKASLAATDTDKLQSASNVLADKLGALQKQGLLTSDNMATLSDAIITNKGHVDDSRSAFDALATKMGLSQGAADKLWTSLDKVRGTYSAEVDTTISASGIVSAVESSSLKAGAKNALLGELAFTGQATGGMVRGKGPAGRDSVPTMLAPGELVIPTAHVPKFADAARKASIPGMAKGGLAALEPGIGATIANIPPSAVKDQMPFAHDTVNAFVADIIKAYQASMQGTPGNVSSYKGVVDTVLGLLGQPLSDDAIVLKQMATESGGNPTAVNNSDINAQNGTPSTGLMQVIAPTFAAYAGPFANTGPFLNGVSTNPEANIYAALNYATHRYGADWTSVLGQGHGYAAGGVVKPYSAGGMVSEPVFGVGARSGQRYSFAENGPEYVGPISGGGTSAGGGGMTSAQAAEMIAVLKGIHRTGQQQPYTLARATSAGMQAGISRGYYATGG